jgi:formate dehydrogenase iron-sulfur subunit
MRYREIGDGDDFRWAFAKIQCMHCLNPACETACIVGALRRDEETGAVSYNQAKCIGCRYCMVACPFGIPTYQWDRPSPWIRKCTFCANRLSGGLEPACVTACPTGAIKLFDERAQAIEEAHRRIEASPDKYVDHVYGENEVGGTAWMYISPVDHADLDFPNVTNEPVPRNARKAMGTLPYYAAGVIVLMAGAYWYTKRRQKIAAGSQEKKEG